MDSPSHTMQIVDDVSKGDAVSFLVQFFGIHEITESFENRNLLVSQLFKDKINEVDSKTSIHCFFVFLDVKSLVGYGEIVRKDADEDAGQEPFEIEFNWKKLVMLPFSDISEGSDYIVRTVEEGDDTNWELKEITVEQSRAFEEVMERSSWETTDSVRARYELLIQPESQPETESIPVEELQPDVQADPVDSGHDRKRERSADSRDRPSRDRSQSTSRQTSRGDNAQQEAPKRSRIPFDVTKMSYDQYCAKHYSYAIEMYRAEKLVQYQAAQTARAMAMGVPMGLPLHLGGMGGMQGVYGMGGTGAYGQPVGQGAVGVGYGQAVGMGVGPQGVNQGYRPQAPMGGYYGPQGGQAAYGAPVQPLAAPL